MTETHLMTRPWPIIAAHFRTGRSRASHAIAGLCDYIAARPVRTGVHGWTSMYTLCITQIPVHYPYEGPVLIVDPVSNESVEFRYEDTFIKSRMWRRTEPGERVIDRFRKTMIQLNWFTHRSVLD